MTINSSECILELCTEEFTYNNFIMPLVDSLIKKDFPVAISYRSSHDHHPLSTSTSPLFYSNNVRRSIRPLDLIKSLYSLYLVVKEASPSVIHVHTPIISYLVRFLRLLGLIDRNVPIIYTVHGFYFHSSSSFLVYYIHLFVELFLACFTDAFVFVSSSDYAFFNKFFPVKRPCVLLPNSVDTHFYSTESADNSAIRKSLDIPFDNCVIGFSGRLVKEKGIAELLHAVHFLSHHVPNLTLLLCGGTLETDHSLDMADLISSYNNSNFQLIRTGLLTNKSSLRDMYSVMDIFCLPSYREGLPQSILEAMSMSLPVVASNIRGCNELVIPNYNGLLFPSRSANSLISCLHQLITCPQTRAHLGQNSRSRVLSSFDADCLLAKYRDYISSFL